MSQRTDTQDSTGNQGTIGVGMIGYAFMGKAHSLAWHTVSRAFDVPLRPRLAAICGRDPGAAAAAAQRLGWAAVETDWRALIARDDVDMVDICTRPARTPRWRGRPRRRARRCCARSRSP